MQHDGLEIGIVARRRRAGVAPHDGQVLLGALDDLRQVALGDDPLEKLARLRPLARVSGLESLPVGLDVRIGRQVDLPHPVGGLQAELAQLGLHRLRLDLIAGRQLLERALLRVALEVGDLLFLPPLRHSSDPSVLTACHAGTPNAETPTRPDEIPSRPTVSEDVVRDVIDRVSRSGRKLSHTLSTASNRWGRTCQPAG